MYPMPLGLRRLSPMPLMDTLATTAVAARSPLVAAPTVGAAAAETPRIPTAMMFSATAEPVATAR